MEVHHHPHPGKKAFAEYLLEGLMIFVAVMMGFIAENIREGVGDRHKEKEYVESLVRNLKDDTANVAVSIQENEDKERGLQALMQLAKKDLADPAVRGRTV